MTWLAYLADVWILLAYLYLARRGNDRPFHWANAIGCIPLLIVEWQTGAYPVMPLTAAFGLIAVYGLYETEEIA